MTVSIGHVPLMFGNSCPDYCHAKLRTLTISAYMMMTVMMQTMMMMMVMMMGWTSVFMVRCCYS